MERVWYCQAYEDARAGEIKYSDYWEQNCLNPMAVSDQGALLSAYARGVRCAPRLVRPPICLRASYAVSGTDIAYGAICLRACYAMSACSASCLQACYPTSGTDLAYGATRAATIGGV
eukprot:441000-Rhodomonas_salina.5